MPALDWAESKLDRSIISIGESCKTWFQEVWRLVFRVLVFLLSILLGFLHKPSFEKWLAEQRGRLNTRRQPTDSSQNGFNPLDISSNADNYGPLSPTGTFDVDTSIPPHDGTQASESPSSRLSKPTGKRKSGRLGRTGFADLLHKSMTPDPVPTNSLLDSRSSHTRHRRPIDRILTSQSQPSSFTDDLILDPDIDEQLESDHRRRASRPSPIVRPDSDDEDLDTVNIRHPSHKKASTRNEDDGEVYDHHTSGYDDYDEFYGPKKTIPERTSQHDDVPPRKNRRKDHKRQPSTSSHDHMFSMEGIDSTTSPLLNLRSSSGILSSAHTTPREPKQHLQSNTSPMDADAPSRAALTDDENFGNPWNSTTDQEEEDHQADANSDTVSLVSTASAPAISVPTSTRRRLDFESSDAGDASFQAQSVPAHSTLETKVKSNSRRTRPKRSRSMSPGGSNSSLYSISHVSGGGTGRRQSRAHRNSDKNEWFNQRYSTIDIHRDRIFTSDKLSTGAMEDLRMWILLRIDYMTNLFRRGVRRSFSFIRSFSIKGIVVGLFQSLVSWITSPHAVIKSIFLLIWNLTFGLLIVLFYLPSRFLSGMKASSFDKRSTRAIVTSQGYPYEVYEVVTDDGYILRLERLARHKSNKIIYFQHGVVDNSFAWFGHVEGEAGSALAFRAYDQGYDVFVGTFRGCEGSTRHIRKDSDFKSSQYWNFSVNEHGMFDLKAFIDKIVILKKQDLGEHFEPRNGAQTAPLAHNQFDIHLIAHSMGAMASLIYLVWSKIKQRPHQISCAILLSPAGYHITAPLIVPLTGPIINVALWLFPWIHTLKFPGQTIRLLVSKILEDINNSFTGRTMMSWGVAKIIGGSIEDHPFVNLRNLTYNVFSGTSTGVFRHFWQIWTHKKFEGYDYGAVKNMQVYGTTTPIDFVENYHLYAPTSPSLIVPIIIEPNPSTFGLEIRCLTLLCALFTDSIFLSTSSWD